MVRRLNNSFSLLNVDHVRLGHRWNYRNIISPYYRIYYIDGGYGTIYSDNNRLELEPGYAYIIPSYTLCNLSCENLLNQYFIQFFEDSLNGISLFENNRDFRRIKADEHLIGNFKRILAINPGRGINRSDNPEIYEKHSCYMEYQELNNRQSMSVFLETQGILLQLLASFLTQASSTQPKPSPIPLAVRDAISYIQLHIQESLSVKQLAERANLNEDYFSRLFKQSTSLSPIKYILEKRIERAQYLIATSDASYKEIAHQTGFENQPYFSKVFKALTGMTPKQYRIQNRTLNFLKETSIHL